MTALAQVRSAGVAVRLSGSRLQWRCRGPVPEHVADLLRDRRAEIVAELRRECLAQLHDRVRAMMAAAPPERTHFYLTDDRADPDHVVVVIGIRGIGTAELSIPRDRYDPFALAAVITGAHGPGETKLDAAAEAL